MLQLNHKIKLVQLTIEVQQINATLIDQKLQQKDASEALKKLYSTEMIYTSESLDQIKIVVLMRILLTVLHNQTYTG